MMKFIIHTIYIFLPCPFQITILVVLCASYAIAAPTETELRTLPALEHEEIHDEYGQYSLRYVTADGTIVTEKGRLVPNPDGNGRVMVVEGSVSYIGDDGKTYSTTYTAGFDGYKPQGAHLIAPVVPEVPIGPVMPVEPVVPEMSAVIVEVA